MRNLKHIRCSRIVRRWLLGVAVTLGACSLDVKNPGAILDEDLNEPELMRVVAAGVSAEFSDVVDGIAFTMARLTDEMVGSGSYGDTGRLRRGIIQSDDTNGEWEQTHEAAWSAEQAIERFRNVLGQDAETSPFTARSYLFEGLGHRILGEVFCEVAYDAGPAEPKTGAFERAITSFNNAIAAAQTPESAEFKTAAYGGLAQAYVGMDDWAAAAREAAKVPTSFVYNAIYHISDNVNVVNAETFGRPEMSAFRTIAAQFDPVDPRAPFTICGTLNAADKVVPTGDCEHSQGASGDQTPHYRQEKYNDLGSEIPVVKGTEMRLIEAEAALRGGDLATFTSQVNQVRAFYGIDPIVQPAAAGSLRDSDQNDAWSILDRERWLTLWLEGRRLWDLHRWDHPFLEGGTLVDKYPPDGERASCFPIPSDECDLNPNLSCT